jgi:hypothetical protein
MDERWVRVLVFAVVASSGGRGPALFREAGTLSGFLVRLEPVHH